MALMVGPGRGPPAAAHAAQRPQPRARSQSHKRIAPSPRDAMCANGAPDGIVIGVTVHAGPVSRISMVSNAASTDPSRSPGPAQPRELFASLALSPCARRHG